MLFDLFDKTETKQIKKLLTRAKPSARRGESSPYGFYTDVLIYLDTHGPDSAYDEGAEFIARNLLSVDGVEALLKHGYVIEGDNVCAFGRLLMLKFFEAAVLTKAADRKEQEILDMLRQINQPDRDDYENTPELLEGNTND